MKARALLLIGGLALGALSLLAEEKAPSKDDCAACHEDVVKAFEQTAHGAAMARRSPEILARSCAVCHAPAPAHLEEPSTANVRRKPAEEACLSCHQDRLGSLALATPGHPRSGVSCTACHAPSHLAPPAAEPMLAAAPTDLCGSCHRAEAARFRLPYAHREGAGPMDCTRCHDVHGLSPRGRLSQAKDGGVCLDCHTEKAGPFVYPHAPQRLDGCLSCHTPHGSANPRLLVRRQVADLCLECHSRVPAFHNLSSARYRDCTRCHAEVHGSNRSPVFFQE